MNDEIAFEAVVQAWQNAGRSLSFKIVSPYTLPGTAIQVVAYLPQFGGPNGAIFALMDDAQDRAVRQIAEKNGLHWSFLNREVYNKFDPDRFKETLIDLGFFGDPSRKPDWMP